MPEANTAVYSADSGAVLGVGLRDAQGGHSLGTRASGTLRDEGLRDAQGGHRRQLCIAFLLVHLTRDCWNSGHLPVLFRASGGRRGLIDPRQYCVNVFFIEIIEICLLAALLHECGLKCNLFQQILCS